MSDYTFEEKKEMLNLARNTITNVIQQKERLNDVDLSTKLDDIRSCFVTLHSQNGNLRGCIGNIEATESLYDNITHNAINAAFKDPRFPQVTTIEELNSLTIEISVLTPPEAINSLDEFIIGEHGIILSKDSRSAVFLPQVATEQGWDVTTTMTQLSMKAGLSHDAWQSPDCKFTTFKAIVFAENEYK